MSIAGTPESREIDQSVVERTTRCRTGGGRDGPSGEGKRSGFRRDADTGRDDHTKSRLESDGSKASTGEVRVDDAIWRRGGSQRSPGAGKRVGKRLAAGALVRHRRAPAKKGVGFKRM